jgi:hypothetical protein
MNEITLKRTRAQESRAAIQRLYIAMRHLFIRGNYKPLGISGEAMIEAMMLLQPEIYGAIADPERVELTGLLYVFERLPKGIEECRYIKLIAREGFEDSHFRAIIPSKRRRNCYRIDHDEMYIEMTRGRSDIYDVLTHLTFMYIEAEKIRRNSLDSKGRKKREWQMLEEIVRREDEQENFNEEVAYTYLSVILGSSFRETVDACQRFAASNEVNSLFHIVYWLGNRSMDEHFEKEDREISFSSPLREKVGHHVYGEAWANRIKYYLREEGLLDRKVHVISSNLHSVMNTLYARPALREEFPDAGLFTVAEALSQPRNSHLRRKVKAYALENGMAQIDDVSGTNISVQIFDLNYLPLNQLPPEIVPPGAASWESPPLLIVMDYAFGEQAYESMDELLKPEEWEEERRPLKVESISIMGKAGALMGQKGDIMIPNAHIFEGTADNYPFENSLNAADFKGNGLEVYEGPMITVMGTSLQNKDILRYFMRSSWRAVGLEMEGAHYQKAIQAASRIRKSIRPDVVLRYAYYASDNPLISGQTLASGSLGMDGVKPTYLITQRILEQIMLSSTSDGS